MKIIALIIGIILILFLAVFSICACVLSSKISKYEGYDRGDRDEYWIRNNKKWNRTK